LNFEVLQKEEKIISCVQYFQWFEKKGYPESFRRISEKNLNKVKNTKQSYFFCMAAYTRLQSGAIKT
jgi:hypothetical protein